MTDDFISRVAASLDPEALAEFGPFERLALRKAMQKCGLEDYPAVSGGREGTRAGGDCVCDRCGRQFAEHPLDWRLIGHGNQPFLNILCSGERVKL